MTKAKAIKTFCFDCAGDSNKEVTLCPCFDCPLWEYRTGQGVNSSTYRSRMDTALKNYAEDLAQMSADGCETGRFYKVSSSKSRSVAKKSRQTGQAKGKAE